MAKKRRKSVARAAASGARNTARVGVAAAKVATRTGVAVAKAGVKAVKRLLGRGSKKGTIRRRYGVSQGPGGRFQSNKPSARKKRNYVGTMHNYRMKKKGTRKKSSRGRRTGGGSG